MNKNVCIICRSEGKVMSDEHIIPEAVGGKIHSYRVCKDCNSKLGTNVDIHLINHWFAQAFRYKFKLKGYSKKIPNPLVGDGTLDDGTRVKLVDESGVISAKCLPTKPVVSDDGKSFAYSVDVADLKEADKIKEKMIKRLGIDLSKYELKEKREHRVIDKPVIETSAEINLLNYKIGVLKIAYEFACEKIPGYFESDDAEVISKILYNADIPKMKAEMLVSDSFNGVKTNILDEYIDYGKENRHILILLSADGKLFCFVRIGNVFESWVRLANKDFTIPGEYTICIDDLDKTAPQYFSLEDLLNKTAKATELLFNFDERYMTPAVESKLKSGEIGIACNMYNDNIIYDRDGNPLFTTNEFLDLASVNGGYMTSADDKGNLKTVYPLAGCFCYKGMPGDYLIPLAEIIELHTITKI